MGKKLDNAIGLYLEGIRDGKPQEALKKYTGSRYRQHSTGVPDGKEGFLSFFESFLKRNPQRDIQVVRALEDGQYVFLHVFQSLNHGAAEWVTADFFKTDENDKLIEHWDVIAEFTPRTPSGHSSIDGQTEITDLEKTEANKQIVRDLIENVLMGKNPARIDQYISSEVIIQHNPVVPDGLEPFKQLVFSPDRPLLYQEIVLLVGQGNFVASLCKTTWGGQPYAHMDLFRLVEGKVVEHWDVAEPVPPREEWVNSGKF